MPDPTKPSVVERATERLIRDGGLHEAATRLLLQPRVSATPEVAPRYTDHDHPAADMVSPETEAPAARHADPETAVSSYVIDAQALERAGMIGATGNRTRVTEELRLIQRQIIRTAFGPGSEPGFSNILLISSARPGEGKSFMAINLAGSIARQGDNHVLLVDADSKRESLCHFLGIAQRSGVLDLAADPRLDPGSMITKTAIERLSVLPVGRARDRSAELIAADDMTRLIKTLGRRYTDRLLILDAPPCLSTSDPAVLSQVVGQVLFVVEAERTQRSEIEASLDLIQACPTITLALNKQKVTARYTFGAYSSYYAS
jgi:protein-tyrosine kinase